MTKTFVADFSYCYYNFNHHYATTEIQANSLEDARAIAENQAQEFTARGQDYVSVRRVTEKEQ
jgi:hypothetical protein